MNRNMMNREYWDKREERAVRAVQHTDEMAIMYPDLIDFSVKNSIIYDANHPFIDTPNDGNDIANISVYDENTVSALMIEDSFVDKRNIAILNFASFKNPGGKFIEGSMAQEESLCHASFLYNVLKEFSSTFYAYNRSHVNRSMYMNRAIYSPAIGFMDDGTKYASCGVITCAAPNMTAGSKYYGVSNNENCDALYSRCKFVLNIADDQCVDTLILGAFGCGVFGQNPSMVANIFNSLFHNYKYKFTRVIFAIPSSGHSRDNYIAFKSVFG